MFFKDRINFSRILGLVLCLIGVLAIISKGNLDLLINFKFTSGDLWMIGAAMGWAIYSIYLLNWKSKFSLMARFTLIAMFGAFFREFQRDAHCELARWLPLGSLVHQLSRRKQIGLELGLGYHRPTRPLIFAANNSERFWTLAGVSILQTDRKMIKNDENRPKSTFWIFRLPHGQSR